MSSRTVQLDGLVLLEIITQANRRLPNYITGQLLGLDVDSTLEVTHCFATPDKDEDPNKYQRQMMKALSKCNVDDNTVGWFFSSFMGTFFTEQFLEAQYSYQNGIPNSVCVVYDPYRTTAGCLFIKAYRLSDGFMELYKAGKFSREDFAKANVESTEILEELPIKVHNSHLVHAFLYEMRENKSMNTDFDRLVSKVHPFITKSLDILSLSVDEYASEQNKYSHHQKDMQRLKQEQEAFLHHRQEEEKAQAKKGLPPLPPLDTSKNSLFKTPPSYPRLDSFLLNNQMNHYAKAISQDAARSVEKLYMIHALHK